ncbi:MAG: LysR family transcriptional regulator [Alphaproteobacteria bacterium]|nr:LysR family transcriptional regulator [Alphaproteobacteria bacterium]
MDRLSHLATFVAVADAQSFSAAADRLDLSRAMASKHIQALEDRLGVKLLERTTRRVRLTDAGRRYLERARRLLQDLEVADTEARGERLAPGGLLRVNGPVSFSRTHLGAAIAPFLSRYPELSVDLTVNDRVVDLLEEGYDVAVRIGRLSDSSLVARRLAPVAIHLAASPGYLALRGVPRHPAELVDHACLTYAYSSEGIAWRFTDASGAVVVARPRGPMSANNGDILTEAAIAGAGIVQQPDFVLGPYFANGSLVRLLPDWQSPELAVHAVHHQSRHVSAKIRVFIDYLAEIWRTPPWRIGVG